MILKLSSETQHCTGGKKPLTSNHANNSQQGICLVNVSDVPVNSLELMTTGLYFSWRVVGGEFCWGFFCSLSEFQVHSDGKCRLWHMFLNPDDQIKLHKGSSLREDFLQQEGNSVGINNFAWGIEMGVELSCLGSM